jgi:hypothetical protein
MTEEGVIALNKSIQNVKIKVQNDRAKVKIFAF